ncbi:MAG: hypothetical protein KDK39_09040 [Leptospiraceae bacterium]|nr:hypothetical protein [Leptospiraceae bacterium]
MSSLILNRKHFITKAVQSGALLGAPALLQACSTPGRLQGTARDPLDNSRENGLREPILQAINCGITAPNPHNVQPWKLKLLSDASALLYIDESRLLLETDPPTRQIHIGQGTFLEHVRLGMLQAGYRTQITLFPQGTYPLSQTGNKPVAKIELDLASDSGPANRKQSQKDALLYDAIADRLTDRTEYAGALLSLAEFQQLQSLVGASHSSLVFINQKEQMSRLHDLFYQAMVIECLNEKTYDESRVWFRYNDQEIYHYRDGISLRANGMGALMRFLVGFFMSQSKADWHDRSNIDVYLQSFQEVVRSSRAYLLLQTSANTQVDWVQTGYDYARVQLALTAMGFKMHPLSQILQEYKQMNGLKSRFNREVGGLPFTQMAVRIGRSSFDYKSPRRPVRDFLVT